MIAPTVKGRGLRFKVLLLHNPQFSMKSGHIQWMTSFQETYQLYRIRHHYRAKSKATFQKINLYFSSTSVARIKS